MSTADLAIEAIELEASVSALANLAKVSALAAAVKRRANVFSLAWHLRKVSGQIKEMLDRTNGIIEGRIQARAAAEPLTPAKIEGLIDTLDMTARSIDYIHESMRRVGLTNNSLTAGSLKELLNQREGVLDLVDWIDATRNDKENAAVFDRARRERELGQTVDLK